MAPGEVNATLAPGRFRECLLHCPIEEQIFCGNPADDFERYRRGSSSPLLFIELDLGVNAPENGAPQETKLGT